MEKIRIFISHSSQNAWLLDKFIHILKTINDNTYVFCSSEASIVPGDNYKESIYENLNDTDYFVCLLSKEYLDSRYCLFELGAAYSLYWEKTPGTYGIIPIVLPPLQKDYALINTPLVEMKTASITDSKELLLALRRINQEKDLSEMENLDVLIAEFVRFVHEKLLKEQDITAFANIETYYDERNTQDFEKHQIVSYDEKDGFLFHYHFNLLDYEPAWASLAFSYLEELNLRDYLKVFPGAAFSFEIENSDNAISQIWVELKYGINQILKSFACDIAPGKNQINIPLADINCTWLAHINEICFVIKPEGIRLSEGGFHIQAISISTGNQIKGN